MQIIADVKFHSENEFSVVLLPGIKTSHAILSREKFKKVLGKRNIVILNRENCKTEIKIKSLNQRQKYSKITPAYKLSS